MCVCVRVCVLDREIKYEIQLVLLKIILVILTSNCNNSEITDSRKGNMSRKSGGEVRVT